MNSKIKINSIVLGFGWNSDRVIGVKVDIDVIESFHGETTTERSITPTEDNFLWGYRKTFATTSLTKIKAGPGKGRRRQRPRQNKRINKPLSFSQIWPYVQTKEAIKLIGDWKCNTDNGTIRSDVTIDPLTARTHWGESIQLIGYTVEATRSRNDTQLRETINDMAG